MKSINIFTVTIISLIILSANTCSKNKPDCHQIYSLKNNTNNSVYSIWGLDSSLQNISSSPSEDPATYKCDPNSDRSYVVRGDCYENHIVEGRLNIFIFDAQVLETTDWQTVKDNYKVLKKYSLTKAQLDSANWMINYP